MFVYTSQVAIVFHYSHSQIASVSFFSRDDKSGRTRVFSLLIVGEFDTMVC